MEILGKFWSIILSIILIFFGPFYLSEARRTMINDIRIITEGDRFLDHIRYRGYLERDELNQFLHKMIDGQRLRKVELFHRRRAVKPIYQGLEIGDTKEFYLEVDFEEIKEKLKERGRYPFYVGDEVRLVIEDEKEIFPLLGSKAIELGGMIENEFTEN